MEPDYSKVHVKMGKMSKAVDAGKITVQGKTLNDVMEENELLKQAMSEQSAIIQKTLSSSLIVPQDREIIVAMDGEIHKGKLEHVEIYKNQNVKTLEFRDGKLKIKKEIGVI